MLLLKTIKVLSGVLPLNKMSSNCKDKGSCKQLLENGSYPRDDDMTRLCQVSVPEKWRTRGS